MGKRHLQSVCNPWLEGAVSASESPCGGCGGGSLQISSSPCFCKEGDWPVFLAGRVLFQVQGDHQALVSPGSHQDGGFQELHKTCILPHVQKCSFICSSFSPTALGGLGDGSARKQNKVQDLRLLIFLKFFFFSVSI